ncbi:MAG: leucine-rich repeat protein [Collinsella sp.]|nr:leucine-rich repeat protein [Collinsella sp.]
MRWTAVRALCRRLTVAAVTLTMVTGSLPAGAFAETLTTDGTFVQTDNGQAVDAAPADLAGAQTPDSASADPAPDAGAADPTVLDTGDTPTPPASEIASAAGLTGAGQTESTPAGTLATDLVEGKELAEQQKQEEASGAEATWNEELELWATSKGATGVKGEDDDGYVAGEQTPAQYYFSIDSLTNEISIEYGDAGITTLEVPSTIDGKHVVSLTGMGSAALTSITFASNSHVRSVGGLGGSSIKEIALPDSVEELGWNAFTGSKTLQTVTWPNNAAFTTIPEQAFEGCEQLDDNVVATLPPSVKTIDYRAFANCGVPQFHVSDTTVLTFTQINVPGTVERIERYAFDGCSHVSSVTIGDGVKYIGAHAFTYLDPALAGKEIVVPKSVQTIDLEPFDNTRNTSSAGTSTTNHNAVTLRVMNPDIKLEEAGLYTNNVTIDGVDYLMPFSEGQTIYAYATDSAGNPSMIKKIADAVADRMDSADPTRPAYTFEWMGEDAQITGKLPQGAAAVLVQAGQSTPLTVGDDGSVAADVLSKTAATLRISLSGYYDMVLARPGDQMTGTWNIGEIKAEDFTKIPASRAIELNVGYLEPVAGQDKTERIELDSLDNIDLTVKSGGKTLKPAKGDRENDYRIQGTVLVVSQAIADADQDLEITLEPKDSLKLGGATATVKPSVGKADIDLKPWGTATVTTKGDYQGANRVLVFRTSDGKLVADGVTYLMGYEDDGTTPIMKAETPRLKAGSYTIIAFNKTSYDIQATSYSTFSRLGLTAGKHIAQKQVKIEDGKQLNVTLDVPTFDVETYRAERGLTAGSVIADSSAVVGVETELRIHYELKDSQAAKIEIPLAKDAVEDVSAGAREAGASSDAMWADTTWEGDNLVLDMKKSAGADVFVRFKPKSSGTYAISPLITLGEVTLPLGSTTLEVSGSRIEVDNTDVHSLLGNVAYVYAAPGKSVQLTVGTGSSAAKYTGKTNKLGRAKIEYDLPQDTLAAERVTLEARVGSTDVAAAAAEVTARNYVRYVPSASVWSFDVTYRGGTQNLVKDGKDTGKSLWTFHHLPQKKNAYWTFDITLEVGNEEAADTLDLYVDCVDGKTVTIPLTQKSREGTRVRYVAEYVDEGYLKLLDEFNKANDSTYVNCGNFEQIFMPQTYRISNAQLMTMLSFDAKASAKKHSAAAEERQQEFSNAVQQWHEYMMDNSFNDVDEAFNDAIDRMVADAFAEEDENGKEDEAQGGAARKARRAPAASDGEGDDAGNEEAAQFAAELKAAVGGSAALLTQQGDSYGVNVDKMIFEDAYGTSEDWYQELAAAQGANAADAAAIKELVDHASRAEFIAQQAEDMVGQSMGIGRLNQYGSWNDATAAALNKCAGIKASEYNGQSTSGFNDLGQALGSSLSYKAADDDTIKGFKVAAPDGEQTAYIESEFIENSNNNKNQALLFNSIAMQCDILDNLYDNWNVVHSLNNSKVRGWLMAWKRNGDVSAHMKLIRTIRSLKSYKIECEMFGQVFKTDAWKAAGQAFPAATQGIGVFTGIYGVNDASKNWENVNVRMQKVKGEREGYELQHTRLLAKPEKTEDDWKCIYALRDAMEKARAFEDLLYRQLCHDSTDVAVGSIMTIAGVLTAGSAGTVVGAAYDAASTSVGSERAVKLTNAECAYDVACEQVERACQNRITVNWGELTDAEVYKANKDGLISDEKMQSIFEARYRNVAAKAAPDPAGVVYEGLLSNTVEGATVELWSADDAAGTNEVRWDAEEYEQDNPLATGADGAYNWNTPTGWYQVRVTKGGYEEARSAWLRVPPIQTEVNIGLVSTAAPEVVSAHAYTDCIEVEFAQYMDASDDALVALCAQGLGDVTYTWLDKQDDPNGKPLSRVLRIRYADACEAGSTVALELDGARNYAGTAMSRWASGELVVGVRADKLKLNVEQAVTMLDGSDFELVAHVTDKAGKPFAGAKVSVGLESSAICSVDATQAVTGEDGAATFVLHGALPGLTTLTAAVDGTALSKQVDVRVSAEAVRPARPVATIGATTFGAWSPKENYITVPKGTKLELSAEDGATIWYTTNDTCPCRDEGRVKYTEPIALDSNMYVRIAAQRPGMSYSEYSERLNITITVTDEAAPEPTPEPTPDGGGQGGGTDGSGGAGVPAGSSTSTTTTVTTEKSKGKGKNGKKSGGTELASTGDSAVMTVAALGIAGATVATAGIAATKRRKR